MLVVVGGLPGSGKTTVARGLSERAGTLVHSSDLVRRELQVPAAKRYTDRNLQRVYDVLLDRARAGLQQGWRWCSTRPGRPPSGARRPSSSPSRRAAPCSSSSAGASKPCRRPAARGPRRGRPFRRRPARAATSAGHRGSIPRVDAARHRRPARPSRGGRPRGAPTGGAAGPRPGRAADTRLTVSGAVLVTGTVGRHLVTELPALGSRSTPASPTGRSGPARVLPVRPGRHRPGDHRAGADGRRPAVPAPAAGDQPRADRARPARRCRRAPGAASGRRAVRHGR